LKGCKQYAYSPFLFSNRIANLQGGHSGKPEQENSFGVHGIPV